MSYMTAETDTAALKADVHYIYGRLGQSDDLVPASAVAFAAVEYDKDSTSASLMVSLFPEDGTDPGLAAKDKFVKIEAIEVSLFDGSNGGSDKMFRTAPGATAIGDYKYDNYCLGAASLAGSVLTLAAVASTLY